MREPHEPSAAGFEYSHRRGSTVSSRRTRVLTYDLGGGTFDTALVDVVGRDHEVLAARGQSDLGGDDIDLLLAEMIASLRWDGAKLSITMNIPVTYPLIPVALIVYAIWRKVKGQTCELAASVGITLLVVPALILLGSFLLSAMTT